MRILLASSELHPFSKTGGLADMVAALAKVLAKKGHHIGVVTPYYRCIAKNHPDLPRMDYKIEVPLGPKVVRATVRTYHPANGLTVYFVEQPEFYDRDGIYVTGGKDFPDNAARFFFFEKCVAHLARYLPWRPEVVHVHDWQTALVPLMIQNQKWREGWRDAPRTCLTIHNLAYQGIFSRAEYVLTNLSLDYFHVDGAEQNGNLNCLKAGILYSDAITTVSPRYAREITTVEYGEKLEGVLGRRQNVLTGLLNGVDYEEWRTAGNPHLKFGYDHRHLEGKNLCKLDLQAELGLPVDEKIPLFGSVTRLAGQKGLDIELGALEEMLSANMQFVLLGFGEDIWVKGFQSLASRYPQKVAVRIEFREDLSHRIEAGCDFFLMPSRFEPCGLNQMYSLRYGTIPIVRRTGGLDDSVVDATDNSDTANGIKFDAYDARALAKAIRKALVLFEDHDALFHYRKNAILADFSWERTAAGYEGVFRKLLATQPTAG